MSDPYRPAPWQQGDILRADELNAMQAGLSPIGTVIPWTLPFAETGGSVYSNVSKFAPFHLPATGGVYETSVAPMLSAAIGGVYGGVLPGMTAHDLTHPNGVGEYAPGEPVCTYDIGTWSGDAAPGQGEFPTGLPAHTWIWCHQIDGTVERYAFDGGTWIHQLPSSDGAIVKGIHYPKRPNGQASIDSNLVPMKDDAVYRLEGQKWVEKAADGFIVPDMRGRSPIGIGNPDPSVNPDDYNSQRRAPVRVNKLGERVGDWRVPSHEHTLWYNQHNGLIISRTGGHHGGIEVGTIAGQVTGTGILGHARSLLADSDNGYDQVNTADTWSPMGIARNIHPSTGVNFLIFAGERISDPTPQPGTGGARSGEPLRLHAVTTENVICNRLSDPDLPDDEREMLTAHLNGELWSLTPPPDEPPATRTTTRKTAKRKKS